MIEELPRSDPPTRNACFVHEPHNLDRHLDAVPDASMRDRDIPLRKLEGTRAAPAESGLQPTVGLACRSGGKGAPCPWRAIAVERIEWCGQKDANAPQVAGHTGCRVARTRNHSAGASAGVMVSMGRLLRLVVGRWHPDPRAELHLRRFCPRRVPGCGQAMAPVYLQPRPHGLRRVAWAGSSDLGCGRLLPFHGSFAPVIQERASGEPWPG